MPESLAENLVGALRAHEAVVAVWLDGSIGRGVADEHSDVDIGVAVADAALDGFLGRLPGLLRDACDPLLLRSVGRLVTLVAPGWQRADVFVRTASEAERGVPGPLSVLHDPGSRVRIDTEPAAPPPGRVSEVIEEFLRCLGLLPIAVARGESMGGYVATGTMAGLLTELMQLENGNHRIGGALRLNTRLTDEQLRELAELPPLRPSVESVVAVHTALARAFLARAPRVAEAAGVPYPDRLDVAARRHLEAAGIVLGD